MSSRTGREEEHLDVLLAGMTVMEEGIQKSVKMKREEVRRLKAEEVEFGKQATPRGLKRIREAEEGEEESSRRIEGASSSSELVTRGSKKRTREEFEEEDAEG